MSSQISFDAAIELLEITNIDQVNPEDLKSIAKRMKKRWHPDRVAHKQDQAQIELYTQKFQQIDPAVELVTAYLDGSYFPGDAFERPVQEEPQDPVEIIRDNAPDLQSRISEVWQQIVESKYKYESREIILSDGFYWKDLLRDDFASEIMTLSIISFVFGSLAFGILALIFVFILPAISVIIGIIYAVFFLSCLLGIIPLSRFWLPEGIFKPVAGFIDFGLNVYQEVVVRTSTANPFIRLAVQIPTLIAFLFKSLIMFPIYEIAKLIVKDKVTGVVKETYHFYAGLPEQYITELISKHPQTMDVEELYDLGYMFQEFVGKSQEPQSA